MTAEDWYRQGNARQDEGRPDLAAECYERAVALQPDHARAWNNLGVCRQGLGRSDAADAYRRALELDPALPQAVANLGHLRRDAGDVASAEPLLARAALFDAGNPAHWEALAMVRRQLGRDDAAVEAFRAWIRCDPGRIAPYVGLADISIRRGRLQEAEGIFREALVYQPEDPMLRHMLAAMRGDSSVGPVEGYVQRLFEGMAPTFDRDLRGLGYRLPEAIAALLLPVLGGPGARRVLDLGCGTGLVGVALAASGAEIAGVDLSAQMLELAAARGVYAHLELGDAVEALRRAAPGSLHAVVAADVFIYVGELQAVFAAAAAALAPGGLFVFSVEEPAEGEFGLTPQGRYAHSAAYLRAQAASRGLKEIRMERLDLRREGAAQTAGLLACFAR